MNKVYHADHGLVADAKVSGYSAHHGTFTTGRFRFAEASRRTDTLPRRDSGLARFVGHF
jgi:hypothetical protein